MVTVVDHALLDAQLAAARALRQRFTSALVVITDGGATADAGADALAKHLATTKSSDLPLAAQTIWAAKVVRPLKADASKPLPARAIAALRSWPSARVAELQTALAEIEKLLTDAENEVHHEVIYAEISKAYS